MMEEKKGKMEKTLLLSFFFSVVVAVCLLIPDQVLGQDIPPGMPGEPDATPIDGGLGILAALGGAYAIKKLRDKE